jgi:putative FmdB family regulatory protein
MEESMPTYEYRCQNCGKKVSHFLSYEDYDRAQVQCPHCGSDQLQRLINRVRVMRSEDSRLDSLSDPSRWEGLDEEDPRAMAKMMREMGQEMGEELPPEFDEVVDRLEAGESPEQIEESMPELADDMGDF